MEVLLPLLCYALLQANEAQLLETKDMAELFDSSSGCCAIHTPLPLRASARGGVALCAARARSEREAEIERASGQAGDREASRKGHAGGGRQTVRETSYARK